MLTSRGKKEKDIVLPNKDKLPMGRIKDVGKFMSVISAEYGIEADIGYFVIEKEKNDYALRLQFIPRALSKVKSVNAKKFIVYELARMGQVCKMTTDDDLNKRMIVINDLLNTIDDSCRETIISKLSAIVDPSGQLDQLLDQLLTDLQFNCFKYAILNEARKTQMLCVNGDGLFVRSTEPPYDVGRRLSWQDISDIKSKGNKIVFRKSNGENEDMVLVNRRTAAAVQTHLMKYLAFIGTVEVAERTRNKGGWFGSFAQKIRQSFNRRPRSNDADPGASVHPTPGKSTGTHYRDKVPPNSVVPDSSVVSDDCMDNVGSFVSPSIKTNSTHDVSLGSANSFMPGASSFEQQQQHSLAKSVGQDDHMSVKTTSTYEVSLDSGPSPRTTSNGSARGDHDSPGPGLLSFGQAQAKKSPPLGISTFSGTVQDTEDAHPPSLELVRPASKALDTRIVAVPPPTVPVARSVAAVPPAVPTRTCDAQAPQHPIFDAVKLPPPPPVRALEPTMHPAITPQAAEASLTIDTHRDLTVEELPLTQDSPPQPATDCKKATPTTLECSATASLAVSANTESPPSPSHPVALATSGTPSTPLQETLHMPEVDQNRHTAVAGAVSPVQESVLQPAVVEPLSNPPAVGGAGPRPSSGEEALEKEQPKKIECKLPISQRKSIPSPKVQRPSRIPSVSPSKEPAIPPSPPSPATKAQSPSDKENYNCQARKTGSQDKYPDFDDAATTAADNKNNNFSRFGDEEYVVDSKTTVTSVSAQGDCVTKKSVKTEVSSLKSSGIQAPKQYKTTTTTITSTVKKPAEAPKSPVVGVPRASGIPRMASK